MVNIIPVIIGIVFVIASIRLLHRLLLEIVWFGAVFGLYEFWQYYGIPFLDFPTIPEFITVMGASALGAWVFLRLIYVLSVVPIPIIQPVMKSVNSIINGG